MCSSTLDFGLKQPLPLGGKKKHENCEGIAWYTSFSFSLKFI